MPLPLESAAPPGRLCPIPSPILLGLGLGLLPQLIHRIPPRVLSAVALAALLSACDGGASTDVNPEPPLVTEAGSAPAVARSERFELRRDAARPGRAEATARSNRHFLIRE